jgi:hypothetical protein
MHYSSGVMGLASVSIAHALPTGNVLWLIARVFMDAAGGLFLLYAVLMSGLCFLAVVAPGSRRGPRRASAHGPHHSAVT